MAVTGRPELERTRFWQGQRLRSRDLDNQLSDEAELRWWHNRALHAAWGVVQGLQVTIRQGEILVLPGLAYDCYGREIVRVRETPVPPPPTEPPEGQSWTLLLRLVAPAAGTCSCPAGASAPVPGLRWKPSRLLVLPTDGVPLARGAYDTAGNFTHEAGFARPLARALTRPLIGSGATVAGKTAWRAWQLRFAGSGGSALGVEVTIDTSAAGFTEIPCYFAWLCGGPLTGRGGAPLTLLDRIVEPGADRFTFSLWLVRQPLGIVRSVGFATAGANLASMARRHLHVCWVGLQRADSPAPAAEAILF